MQHTLESVSVQSELPKLWVIVDDGSTDASSEILRVWTRRFDWIRVVRRKDRGCRSVGPGVIEAFYAGYETIEPHDFDFICKLDLDVDLPARYFELLMARMEFIPRLGTCSGKAYYRRGTRLISEGLGDENSAGMTKFYRVRCFEEIGGFVPHVMWDGVDGHRCRMHGWVAASWDEEQLRFTHMRPMGSSHGSIWTGRMRHGAGQWFMGTGIVYMAASALFRTTKWPVLFGGLAMMFGYLSAMFRRQQRYDDLHFRRFLRQYQRLALLYGKAEATRRLNEKQRTLWEEKYRAVALPRESHHTSLGK